MSVVMLILLAACVLIAAALLVAMFVKDESFYGAMGVCVLAGPGTLLAILHLALR